MSRGLRALAGVALIAVGALTSWAGGAGLVMAGISLLVGAALEKTPAKLRRLQEQNVMVRSAVEPQEIVFGEVKKSGVIAWYDSNGPHNKYLWFVIAICEHEIDSYSELWIDGTRVNRALEIDVDGFVTHPDFIDSDGNPLVKAGFYTGQDTQTADPDLVSQVGGYWTNAHKGNGVAYIWIRCEIDHSKAVATGDQAQNVWAKGYPREVAATLKGALVYDPRNQAHVVNDKSTWEWSDNPVLCRAHYLRHDRFGPGFTHDDIDWEVVKTQANICDEMVTTPEGQQKRYVMNGVVSTADTGKAILEDMQTCDFGNTIFDPSGIKILAGAWDAPSHTIDNSWLAGPVSGTSAVPADNNYNAVRGQYLSQKEDWRLVGFVPRTSSAFESEDGIGRKYSDISLGFTTNEYYAQRIAIIELKKSRLQGTLTLECNYRAELVELYQTVTVNVDGYNAKTFRVIQITSSAAGTTSLSLKEETAAAWTYALDDMASRPIVPTVWRTNDGPPAVKDLVAFTIPGGIGLTWSLADTTNFIYAELYASLTNDRSAAGLITRTLSESYTHNLPANDVRYYWIVARGWNGQPSEWEPIDPNNGVYGIAGGTGSGVDGQSVFVGNVYLRKATAPNTPLQDDGSYNFTTHVLTPPSTALDGDGPSDDDWFVEPPAGSEPLYVSSATFSISGTVGTDETCDWSTPDLLVHDGAPGDAIHVANVYKRSDVMPATPTANDGSFNFDTLTLTPPSGWETTPPDGYDPLYVSSGLFSAPGGTGTDSTVVWSAPDLLTHDGAGFVPPFAPGYIGGQSNFIYALNTAAGGASSNGDIRVTGTKLIHPTGTEITPASSPFQISTVYSGAVIGVFYIAYRASGTQWRVLTHDDVNGWRERSSSGTYSSFTPVATDTIIAKCEKTQTSGGINSIQVLTSGLPGLDGADGADGSAGTNARGVNLTADQQVFEYDTNGQQPYPASTKIYATASNTTGTVYYEFFLNDVSVQNPSTPNDEYVYFPAALYASMPDKVEVQIREGANSGPILARDQITISALKAGADAITISLSNEAHTLPATNTGDITYTGSGTDIEVWEGTTQVPRDASSPYDRPSFRVTAVGTDIDAVVALTHPSATVWRYDDAKSMSAIKTTAKITYTITVVNSAGVESTFTRVQSFAKSIEGDDGIDGAAGLSARAVFMTLDKQAFVYNVGGTSPVPGAATVTAEAINTVGDVWYDFQVDDVSQQNLKNINTYGYTPATNISGMPQKIEVRIREGGADPGFPILARDQVTVYGLQPAADGSDGTSGITIALSNEAHTMPKTKAGVIDYAGSGTEIRVWEGTTPLPYSTSTAASRFKVSHSTQYINAGSQSTSGTYTRVYGIANGFSAFQTRASITFTITVRTAANQVLVFTKVQTFSLSVEGGDGAAGDDGVSAFLSRPSPVIPTNSDGSGVPVYSYGGFTDSIVGTPGEFKVNEGGVDISSAATFSVVGGIGTGSYYKTQNGATLSINTSTGAYFVRSTGSGGWSTTSETFTLRARYKAVDYDLEFSITKALSGDGGTSSQPVSLSGGTVRHTGTGGANGVAAWYLYGDGREMAKRGTTVSQRGTWLSAGSNSDYEAKAVSIGDATPSGSTLGSWLGLTGSSIGWTATATIDRVDSQLSVKIRNKTTGVVIDTAIVTLVAIKEP